MLIAFALLRLAIDVHGHRRLAFATAIVGVAGQAGFLITVDVSIYFIRRQADIARGKGLLDLGLGFYDLSTRWAVTRAFPDRQDEVARMSLHFSVGMWSSLALCGFGLVKSQLFRGRIGSAKFRSARQFPIAPGA